MREMTTRMQRQPQTQASGMFWLPRVVRMAVATGVAGMALTALPAHAGLFNDDEARQGVLDLRQRMDALTAQLTAAQRTILDQSNRIDQLGQQVATLRGQNEEAANQLATLQKQQKDYYADLDGRLSKLEPQPPAGASTGGGSENGNGGDNGNGNNGAQNTPEQSGAGETQMLAAASQQFRSDDFKGAAASFRLFIARYPQSPNQPAAQYWLGNALYASRDYRGSTAAWQGVVKNYPQSPRAPDALFAIANNQIEQGQKAAARRTLEALVAQYGNSGVAQSAQQRLAQLK